MVEDCDRTPVELCINSWTSCGYKSEKDLVSENPTSIVAYNEENIGVVMRQVLGNVAHINFQDEECVSHYLIFPD